jgi:hypothetical protein
VTAGKKERKSLSLRAIVSCSEFAITDLAFRIGNDLFYRPITAAAFDGAKRDDVSNQFKISCLCERMVLATVFIGSSRAFTRRSVSLTVITVPGCTVLAF